MTRFEFMAEVPLWEGETIVSMCSAQGAVIVCTSYGRVFTLTGKKLAEVLL